MPAKNKTDPVPETIEFLGYTLRHAPHGLANGYPADYRCVNRARLVVSSFRDSFTVHHPATSVVVDSVSGLNFDEDPETYATTLLQTLQCLELGLE